MMDEVLCAEKYTSSFPISLSPRRSGAFGSGLSVTNVESKDEHSESIEESGETEKSLDLILGMNEEGQNDGPAAIIDVSCAYTGKSLMGVGQSLRNGSTGAPVTIKKSGTGKVNSVSITVVSSPKKAATGIAEAKTSNKGASRTNDIHTVSRIPAPTPLLNLCTSGIARRSSLGGHETSRLGGRTYGGIIVSERSGSASSNAALPKKRTVSQEPSAPTTSTLSSTSANSRTKGVTATAKFVNREHLARRASLGGGVSYPMTISSPTRTEVNKWAFSPSTSTKTASVSSTARALTHTRSALSKSSAVISTSTSSVTSAPRRCTTVEVTGIPPMRSTASSSSRSPAAGLGRVAGKTPTNKPDSIRTKSGRTTGTSKGCSDVGSSKHPSICGDRMKGLSTQLADPVSSSKTRRKSLSLTRAESRDPRLLSLPSTDIKTGDDVVSVNARDKIFISTIWRKEVTGRFGSIHLSERLEMRGQKLRTIDSKLVYFTPKLEFVYLRDNKLSSLEGFEILKRLKVLDLSFNEFKGSGLEALANCKALQQLYLAGNQITSLSGLPQLPNLEFLSVAQNKIKSLTMSSQPRLQVLAASKNKVSTFKGFPDLPALEHLRLEENPILDVVHVEAAFILLCGPTLKKFNDRDLSIAEQELAKLYPATASVCLRHGWELCNHEEAAESTLKYLSAGWGESLPPGYRVKSAEISLPREEDPCLCTFVFERVEGLVEHADLSMKYQWFLGGRTPLKFVPVEGATDTEYWPTHGDVGRCLKVECSLISGETEYPPVFAVSHPVVPGTGIPRVINLGVEGNYVEGGTVKGSANVAWCGGTPSVGIVKWLRCVEDNSPVEIEGANSLEYQTTLEDINASLLFVYCPVSGEGLEGEPRSTCTPTIQPAPPSVNNVQIVGNAVDGNMLTGCGNYFGGVEGLSKFEWLRENLEAGQFKLVSRGSVEYTLGSLDVGLRLMFVYTPVNCEGKHGDSLSAISSKVQMAPPTVTEMRIVGDLVEGNKVSVSCSFSGGLEGPSRVQWFKTRSQALPADESTMEAVSTFRVAKAFRIPLGAVGYYLVAKYTPVRSDGESGVSDLIISDNTVRVLPPGLNFLSITGDYSEGKMLSAQYGYVGGYEGKSEYCWFLHENENDSGMQILSSVGRLEYEITKFAVNKYVSFRCTPVRDDGVVGETRTAFGSEIVRPGNPRVSFLQIVGTPVEGEELYVDKEYWGGVEGHSRLQWYLTRPDGTQREIKGEIGSSYVVRPEDIDGLLCVSCEPMRLDGVRGPLAISPVVGPVLPSLPTCESLEICGDAIEGGFLRFEATYKGGEQGICRCQWYRLYPDGREARLHSNEYLGLTADDIGCQIQLVFTPVRKDGISGEPVGVTSGVVVEGEPEGKHLFIPECHEDVEVVPEKIYFGGKEGSGEITWYQVDTRPDGIQLPEEVKSLHHGSTYTPELADVGKYLLLRWVPMRSDGARGEPLLACSRGPVLPARPKIFNVCLREVSVGMFVGYGDYFGGYEGQSKISWYRQTSDGYQTLIHGATSKTYVVCDHDYTSKIIFGYAPVRSDGFLGDLVLSEPSSTIYPELPRIQKLVISGKAVEGEILTALEVIPKGDSQQRSWDKFKKEIKYFWSRSQPGQGDGDDFEAIALQRACSYKVRLEDVGYCVRCECIVSDVFGRVAEPVACVTPPVTPGLPRIDKLEVEGRGFHTSLYAVRGIYFGGREGVSTLQWFRAMAGSPDLIPTSGEVGRMYEANVDDVGYRLVAVYTPIREDGVEGVPTSASTEPIQVEPEVACEVKAKMEVGKVKFEALRDKDRLALKEQQQQGLISLERRVLNLNMKRLKVVKPASKTSFSSTEFRGSYAPPFHVEIFRSDQHRVKLVLDSENEVDLMVQSRHIRDIIVLVVRGLAQRFNSTPLNLLLKIGSKFISRPAKRLHQLNVTVLYKGIWLQTPSSLRKAV